ncbi:hypothetical protein ACS3UN_12995 [Oscillospiraceae bacterium LTW-04]|nr:hypothetical protein RBH76_00805 [Oscillospiraceae bacterium MB24-C1]
MEYALTYMHYIYLAVIIIVIGLMITKHDVVIPCILGLFVIGFCYHDFSVIAAAQTIFNGMLVAGADLFDIMLIIALMTAMLKSLTNMKADKLMIAPAAKLLNKPTIAFWVLAAVMYICATFFWPTPATALVGTILIPMAMSAGLKPTLACIAINLAGHGMALSGDLVLQGAPAITSAAAGVEIESVLKYGAIFAFATGAVALISAFVINYKDFSSDDAVNIKADKLKEQKETVENVPPYAKFFAILVPVVYIGIVIRILLGAAVDGITPVFGGDATALLGGTGAMILVVSTIVDTKKDFLERIVVYLREGMLFSIKIFAPVIPIAAFFFMGNPESVQSILDSNAPGFLFDLGGAFGTVLPLSAPTLAIGIAVVGAITGLDGSGFSGLPLVAGLAAALAGPIGYNVAVLAGLGQVAAIWVGGGCLSAWAFGAVASAGVAGISSAELVRKNLVPVLGGLAVSTVIAIFLL